MNHIFCRVLVDYEIFLEYVSRASYIQKTLNPWPSKSTMAQVMWRLSAPKMQLYFQAIMLLEESTETKVL